MFLKLFNSGRIRMALLLMMMAAFSFCMSVFRYYASGSVMYLFLNWNLFLSMIPWILSSIIIKGNNKCRNIIFTFFLLILWLLFFPNAPYILTDLLHLKQRTVPLWFDLALIISFAWCGLAFGLTSLLDIEQLLLRSFKRTSVNIIIFLMLFISSFGIYLGRFIRWNSWDILSNPSQLFSDIADRFINPFDHPRTWGMTILFGVILNMIYWSVKLLGLQRVKVG